MTHPFLLYCSYMDKIGYIYRITNNVNGKTYIGQRSIKKSRLHTDSYFGSGVILKQSIAKYGKENFIKTIILVCDISELDRYEIEMIRIERMDSKSQYNLTDGGHTTRGHRHTKECIERMRQAKLGINSFDHTTDEYRKKMSEFWKGRVFSEESKQKMREGHKNRKPFSDEYKKKMSDRLKAVRAEKFWSTSKK